MIILRDMIISNKRGKMGYLRKILLLVLLIIFSSLVISETETPVGIFNVSNVAPTAPYNWSPASTHNKSQIFAWTEGFDANGDAVSTYVCITNDTDVDSCSVVNTNRASPSYVFTQAESNWDYLWGTAVRNYYVKLTPNDGYLNGTVNNTIYFTLYDYLPVINKANTTGYADALVDEGENITFYVNNFTDADAADTHLMRACKTNSITTAGVCAGGEYCNKTPYSALTNQNCTVTATDAQMPSNLNYAYFFICDCPPNDNSCPGQCSASKTVPFYINHKPQINGTPDIKPDSPTSIQNLNCTYIFYDKDGDSEANTTFRWFRNNTFTGITTQTVGSGNLSNGEVWKCEVKPQDEHGLYGNAVNSSTETIGSAAPTFIQITEDNSTSTNPTNEGANVTFTANATDPDLNNYTLLVCYTNNRTNSSCEGGQQVCKSIFVPSGTTASCQHNTSGETSQSYAWYSWACDTNNDCSAMENTNSPYYVNHRPNATNVDIKPDSPNTNNNLTCNYTFNDADSDADTSTFRWFNYTGAGWAVVGVTTKILPSAYTKAFETWMCEVTPIDGHSFTGTAVNSTNETIVNTAPTQPTNFSVQDGAASYDNTAPYDGHDNTPYIQWSSTDNDGDTINTTICVSSNVSNRNSNVCDVYQVSTTNLFATLSGLNYNGLSVDYYLRLTPNDGYVNGTYLDVNYTLLNSQPNTPTGLNPIVTHNQTPLLTWTSTDPDNGSIDHWPADTLTYYIQVGTSYGDGSYENNLNANNAGEQVNNPIPWGTPGAVWANNTVYTSIWSSDSYLNSTKYNTTILLYDFLPDITNVEMTDDGGAYSSCTAATCAINPVEYSNATVAVRITTNDTDNDCDGADANGEVWIYLCLNTTTCSEALGNYDWEVDSVSRAGSVCTYVFSSNKTAADNTPEFFRAPNSTYKLWINATDQTGRRTSDNERFANWTYGTLTAVDYPSVVILGDGNISLGEWNNGTYLAVMTNWGNNILDADWNSTDPTSGADTWILNGTDMQIDDDSVYADESSGNLAPVFVNYSNNLFMHGTGLERCTASACSDANVNETLDTYFHIHPPYGLLAGTYNSTITITLTTHS